jgi:hypothetical protein
MLQWNLSNQTHQGTGKGKKELTIQSEKLEDKQNKTNTTQYVLDTTMRKQTQIA